MNVFHDDLGDPLKMNKEAARQHATASSSSHRTTRQQRAALDELDGDEAADLSLDNTLLADDPLAEEEEQTPSVSIQLMI